MGDATKAEITQLRDLVEDFQVLPRLAGSTAKAATGLILQEGRDPTRAESYMLETLRSIEGHGMRQAQKPVN